MYFLNDCLGGVKEEQIKRNCISKEACEVPDSIISQVTLMVFLYHVKSYIDGKQNSYETSKMQIARKVARSGAQHS